MEKNVVTNKSAIYIGILGIFLAGFMVSSASAGGREEFNGCRGTTDDPCTRHGYCSVQRSDWYQWVTATRVDKFDVMGWPGLCDLTHVALLDGSCDPQDAQTNVTVYLGESSTALVDQIVGTLACGGEVAAPEEICGNGIDDNGDGKIDEKRFCR